VSHICTGWWPLKKPLDGGELVTANRRLADALGADRAATDLPRVLRVAGTTNRKGGRRSPVSCVNAITTVHDPLDVLGELPEARKPQHVESHRRPVARWDDDPLREVPTTFYVERLTGQAVPRSCKVHCPLHDDRTPSFHAYEHGWYCHGCRAGGSVYDLAARLWGIGTRGSDFVLLRRRLLEEFAG
jgi:hypothetical protein